MNRPFQCANCKNWYIAVPTEFECALCVEGTHAPHHRTGVMDCHFSQTSPHPSEIRMMEVLATVESVIAAAATGDLVAAERAFAQAERAEHEIPTILTWAGVIELPGLVGAARSQRFKNMEAVEDLVSNSRRPRSDLEDLQRSVRTCEDIANDVPALMARARIAIGQLRNAAMSGAVAPPAPAAETPAVQENAGKRLARARAAKKAERVAAASAA